MLKLFEYGSDETIYMKHFFGSSFTGDPYQEDLRNKKVADVIKAMGDKYVLAKPIKRLTEEN